MKIIISYIDNNRSETVNFSNITEQHMQGTLSHRKSIPTEFKFTFEDTHLDYTQWSTWFSELAKAGLDIDKVVFKHMNGTFLDKSHSLIQQIIEINNQRLQAMSAPASSIPKESTAESKSDQDSQPGENPPGVSIIHVIEPVDPQSNNEVPDAESDSTASVKSRIATQDSNPHDQQTVALTIDVSGKHTPANHVDEQPTTPISPDIIEPSVLEMVDQPDSVRNAEEPTTEPNDLIFDTAPDTLRQVTQVIDPPTPEDSQMVIASSSGEPLNRQQSIGAETPEEPLKNNTKATKLAKIDVCLRLLFNKTVELQRLAGDNSDSLAFRLYKITTALHQSFSELENRYLNNQDITDEAFQQLARRLLTSPFTVEIKPEETPETVNIKQEMSRHPQWGLLSIIDNLLWCIDLYRLVTGTRLSFMKIAQPEYMNQIESIQEEVQQFCASAG